MVYTSPYKRHAHTHSFTRRRATREDLVHGHSCRLVGLILQSASVTGGAMVHTYYTYTVAVVARLSSTRIRAEETVLGYIIYNGH